MTAPIWPRKYPFILFCRSFHFFWCSLRCSAGFRRPSAGIVTSDLRYFIFFETQWKFARWLATLLLMCLGIDLMNYFLPAAGLPWRWITPGTVFVALAFATATILFNLYVAYGSNIPK